MTRYIKYMMMLTILIFNIISCSQKNNNKSIIHKLWFFPSFANEPKLLKDQNFMFKQQNIEKCKQCNFPFILNSEKIKCEVSSYCGGGKSDLCVYCAAMKTSENNADSKKLISVLDTIKSIIEDYDKLIKSLAKLIKDQKVTTECDGIKGAKEAKITCRLCNKNIICLRQATLDCFTKKGEKIKKLIDNSQFFIKNDSGDLYHLCLPCYLKINVVVGGDLLI